MQIPLDIIQVYVMTKIKVEDTLTFWDPATATAYKKDDENCPLVNIGCLVSSSVSKTNKINKIL